MVTEPKKIDAKDIKVDAPFTVDIDKQINKNIAKLKTDEELNIIMNKRRDMEYTQRLMRVGATNRAEKKDAEKRG